MPRVTVLMSVFNAERFLAQAVESILRQSFEDFEFIIVNDGSLDRSRQVLGRYADRRLSIIENSENLGLTRSLNIGLRHARGELVARMDADDIAHPDRLALQVAFLEANPDYVLVGSSLQVIDESGTVLAVHDKEMDHFELLWLMHVRTPLEHSSATYRYRARGQPRLFYNEKYRTAQDLDFWIRLLAHGKGAVLPQVLLSYRKHRETVTATLVNQQLENITEIVTGAVGRWYALSGVEQARVQELVRFLNLGGPCQLRQFARAQATMNWLAERYIAMQSLPAGQAGFIRRRACGQLWNAALNKRSPGFLCRSMMPIVAPRSFLRVARRRLSGEQHWVRDIARGTSGYRMRTSEGHLSD